MIHWNSNSDSGDAMEDASLEISEVLKLSNPEVSPLKTLTSYLSKNNLNNLADLRLQGPLMADEVSAKPSERLRSSITLLNTWANFEGVTQDANLIKIAAALAISNPQDLLSKYTSAEFEQAAISNFPEAPEESLRLFYQQATIATSLSKIIGFGESALTVQSVTGESESATSANQQVASRVMGLRIGEDMSLGTTTPDLSNSACNCNACQSAVGPTAYLSALLQYATQYLKRQEGGNAVAISAQDLQTQLRQPFCDLSVTCQSAEAEVCKYRLAVEVLRRQLNGVPLGNTTRPYLLESYALILAALGTSVDELAGVAQVPEAKTELAVRLGIPAAFLSMLSLETAGVLSEEKLEELFGLVNTDVWLRNPLSSGSVLSATNSTRVVQWQLNSINWISSADQQGKLYGTLQLQANGDTLIRISTSAGGTTADVIVAQGLLSPDAVNPSRRSGRIYAFGESGLEGSILLEMTDYSAQGHAASRLTFTLFPQLTAARLRYLEDGWAQEDRKKQELLLDWNGLGFIIDPDVIGPDDIRPANAQGLPGAAYLLWQKRYEFLEDILIDSDPNVRSVVQGLPTLSFTYSGLTQTGSKVAWPASVTGQSANDGTIVLQSLISQLQSNERQIRIPAEAIVRQLGLSTGLLLRLQQLLVKETQSTRSDEDVEEAISIVRGSIKAAFTQEWIEEEETAGIEFSGAFFQLSIQEPVEGAWQANKAANKGPLLLRDNTPFVDPDVVTPAELPDAGLGNSARQLWEKRRRVIDLKMQHLLSVGIALADPLERANEMLRIAYDRGLTIGNDPDNAPGSLGAQAGEEIGVGGGPNVPLNALSFAHPEDAVGPYQDLNAPAHATAQSYVERELGLTGDEFARLLRVRQEVQQGVAPESSWRAMASILTQGWKRAVAYNFTHRYPYAVGDIVRLQESWIVEEEQARDSLATIRRNALVAAGQDPNQLTVDRKHVLFYKQQLAPGRGLQLLRAQWHRALLLAFERPVIDPDQLLPSDFRLAALTRENSSQYVSLSYQLFADRNTQVSEWAQRMSVNWAGVEEVLRVSRPYIESLYEEWTQGGDVAPDLRRLNLTVDGLRMVVGHLNQNTTEAGEVRDLLTQVLRVRHYATWRREELARNITNSPRIFRQPAPTEPFTWQQLNQSGLYYKEADPATEETSHLPWRTSASDRNEWRQQLRGRYTQIRELLAGWQEALREVEETTMPTLRDILIQNQIASPSATAPIAQKRRYLADRYYVDFGLNCCQYTTRVGQAIEVLQKLFFEHRSGRLNPATNLRLQSVNDQFEQDWQWLSTFERWRSLMLMYLYPENLLLPALSPQQTSSFRSIVQQVRTSGRISPAEAGQYMKQYEASLLGISDIALAASTQTTISVRREAGRVVSAAAHQVLLQVGQTSDNELRWNMYQNNSVGGEAASTWETIPLEAAQSMVRVVGSHAFLAASGQHHLQVFLHLREQVRTSSPTGGINVTTLDFLGLQRLDLQTLEWEAQPIRLTIPGNVEMGSLHLALDSNETLPAILVGLKDRQDSTFQYQSTTYSISSELQPMSDVVLFWRRVDVATRGLSTGGDVLVRFVHTLKLLFSLQRSSSSLFFGFAVRIGNEADPLKFSTLQVAKNISTLQQAADFSLLEKDPNDSTKYRYLNYNSFRNNSLSSPSDDANIIPPDGEPVDLADKARRYIVAALSNNQTTFLRLPSLARSINNNSSLPILDLETDAIKTVGIRVTDSQGDNFNGHDYDAFRVYFTKPGVTNALYIPFRFSYNTAFDAPADWTGEPQLLNAGRPLLYIGPTFKHSQAAASTTPANTNLPRTVWQTTTGGVKTIYVADSLDSGQPTVLHRSLAVVPKLLPALSEEGTRASQLRQIIQPGTPATSVINYLREAYYSLPLLVAQELQRGRNYEEALRYYRLVYDYLLPSDSERIIYPPLIDNGAVTIEAALAWLQDSSNPYYLADIRPGTHQRYVITSIVRCLLAYADEEFARDSAESVGRARSLYDTAQRLMEAALPALPDCAAMLAEAGNLVSLTWKQEWEVLAQELSQLNNTTLLDSLLYRVAVPGTVRQGIAGIFQQEELSWEQRFRSAWKTVQQFTSQYRGTFATLCQTVLAGSSPLPQLPQSIVAQLVSLLPQTNTAFTPPYVPTLNSGFCVPVNSLPSALLMHAELSLAKISSCRNIAGVQRELEPYSGAENVDLYGGAGREGLFSRPSRIQVPATQYRYSYLLDRAKQLINLAQQAEAALLSALEKRDAEEYNLLKARQDIGVSRATVRLQDLRVGEASNGIGLATLQLQRSQAMEQQYSQWINAGLNGYERAALKNMAKAKKINKANGFFKSALSLIGGLAAIGTGNPAAAIGGIVGGISGVGDTLGADASAKAQEQQTYATYERRNDEWKFQRNLSQRDVAIGNQQIVLAQDRLLIVGQEKAISELQLDNAEAVLNFLTTKFTNAELYDWMSQILEAAYSYFLQQATATARLAEQQLAFERQELALGLILQDYWTAPTSTGSSLPDTADRKGITGSTRLLQDLTRLDQYAFETNRRKLQLTKTVSLAQQFPAEFAQFRDTGVLPFALLQRTFDQDFPGHYLRTIRRVRTSVIALVPPVEGIKAKLSATGISRVVVPGRPFQTITLIRQPEAVALTASINATGLFELEQQPSELLYPFEGMGVDSAWTFSMQKAANPFDFDTIADVLLTLEYTAYESGDYAQLVRQQLGTHRQQVLTLSLRNQFADQWYDLHHPAEVAQGEEYTARITLTPADLPIHLRDVRLAALSLYVDVATDEATDNSGLGLRFTRAQENEPGFTLLTNRYGLISTRSGTGQNGNLYNGNALALLPQLGRTPVGEWVLSLDDAATNRLRTLMTEGKVDDIYLLLEVEGEVPAYELT